MKNKYSVLKTKVKLRKFFRSIGVSEPPIEISDEQKKAISVMRSITKNPNSVLVVDPLLNVCYGDYDQYSVKLSSSSIIIKSPDFDCFIDINLSLGEKLIHFFYSKVSERRVKKDLTHNLIIIDKLDKINKDINKIV